MLSLVLLARAPADARLSLEMDRDLDVLAPGGLFGDLGAEGEDDEDVELHEGTLSLDLLGLGAQGAPWARCWRGKRDVLRIGHDAGPDGRRFSCRQALLSRAWRRRYAVSGRPRPRIRLARVMPVLRMPPVAGGAPSAMGPAARGRFARGRPASPAGAPGAHYGFVFTALFVLRGSSGPPPKPPTLPASSKPSFLAGAKGER